MLPGFLKTLWGDLSNNELKKFSILSCIITIILGNYWMLRVLKNPIFNDLVGLEYQPQAKMLSILVVAFIILVYSKLVDIFDKKALFDIICTFYGIVFFVVCLVIIYSDNLHASYLFNNLIIFFDWVPGKLIGWVSYFAFESYSLLMVLFWSFVASITKPESAKKGYPMIITCTQIGTISGPALVTHYAPKIGAPMLVGFGGMLVLLVPLLVRFYNFVIPFEEDTSSSIPVVASKKELNQPKTGFLEGIKLIFTKPYVAGILVVSTIYEIIGTILEFQMNMIAKEVFASRDLFAAFMGKYGVSINSLTMLFALLGTSFFMRKFGLRFCLIAYPMAIGVVLLLLLGFNFIGANHVEIMWALFASMVAVKVFSFSLNNPTKEVMYIPTTKDIQFKAKGWIESFGSRTAKGMGAGVNYIFANNLSGLLLSGTLISLGIVGFWICIANLLGKQFNKLQTTGHIVS